MLFKKQCVVQKIKDAYIIIVSQLKIAFDLSFAAQTIDSKFEDVKLLNKQIQWQLNHFNQELKFV